MTPEEEAQLKEQSLEKLRQRLGDEYMEKHAKLHEAQWEWAKQLGFLDPETDLVPHRIT